VALVGDNSDNLPSVPGVGAATAGKLLAGKANCTELFADLGAIKSARLRETLLAHQAQILSTESLARLRDDAPLPEAGPHWATPSASGLSALAAVFEELEFKSLLKRLQPLIEH
jgi:DNA polymerase-1